MPVVLLFVTKWLMIPFFFQYIFLKCPKISHLEWHPFTLTSVSLLMIKQSLKFIRLKRSTTELVKSGILFLNDITLYSRPQRNLISVFTSEQQETGQVLNFSFHGKNIAVVTGQVSINNLEWPRLSGL